MNRRNDILGDAGLKQVHQPRIEIEGADLCPGDRREVGR
jgi:hypothetical protein